MSQNRRRLQFSLRELLIAVAFLSAILGFTMWQGKVDSRACLSLRRKGIEQLTGRIPNGPAEGCELSFHQGSIEEIIRKYWGSPMRRMFLTLVMILAAASMLWPIRNASARKVDAMRCSGGVVTEGTSMVTTMERCGEPENETMRNSTRSGNFSIENEWSYNLGPQGSYVLRFDALGLRDIYSE